MTPEWVRDFQFWIRCLKSRRLNKQFSNFGEQLLIDKYLRQLRITNTTAVDIGAGDGIRMSNTYHLFKSGWIGVGIEADTAKYNRLKKAYSSFKGVFADNRPAQPDNICAILKSYKIENDFGLLSLDIDGIDYWVLESLLTKYRPRLIVSEINEKIPPPIRFVVKYDPAFRTLQHFYGYSIAKLEDLLKKYDYVLLDLEYNNAFLAPAESTGVTALTTAEAYKKGYAERADRMSKFTENSNMEILHSISPTEGIAFLTKFYAANGGSYEIGLDQ